MHLSLGCTALAARAMPRDKITLQHQAPFPLQNRQSLYRDLSAAQKIRDKAGLPAGIEAGIQSRVTPGLTNEAILSAGVKIQIADETTAQNLSSSGDGTAANPYVIENLDYNGAGTTNWALRLNDPDAAYHIKFINCRFYDWTAQNIWFDTWGAGSITFEHCEFYNTIANAELFLHEQGQITLSACVLSGCASFAGYLVSASGTGSLTLHNILITSNQGNWNNASDVFYINSAALLTQASAIEVQDAMPSTGAESIFQLLACADGSYFSQLKMNGGFDHMICDDDTDAMQKSITIENFDLQGSLKEAILLTSLKNTKIRYGYAAHDSGVGAGYRLIFLSSSETNSAVRIEDTDVEYIHFNKQSGSGANNECLESARAKNTRFRNCYASACSEDAFEHIAVITGCTIEYCVADNCTGQVADFYKQWDELSWTLVSATESAVDSQSYCHHIYGDCSSYALICSGLRGLYFHDINADNTNSATLASVRIEDRDGITVRDIYGAGSLPLQLERGDATTTQAIDLSGGAQINVSFSEQRDGSGALSTYKTID